MVQFHTHMGAVHFARRKIKMEESKDKLLEALMENSPSEHYFVDRDRGTVFIRNDMFEAGGGTLYEIIGKLDPKIIKANKENMYAGRVAFFGDENREETLRDILIGWTQW